MRTANAKRVKAAVLYAVNTPLVVEEVEVLGPLTGQVMVKMVATGVCHSDIHPMKGDLPVPTPCVLGHEGAGIVEEVGQGVTTVKPGDHVVISIAASCGKCPRCFEGQPYFCESFTGSALGGTLIDGSIRLRRKGGHELYHFFCQSSFAEYAVVNERQVVKIREDAPLTVAALLGCGVSTGVSAVLNHAKVRPGTSVAVFGCGGVGLSVVMAAHLVGAGKIIAVDVRENKLALAQELGATHVINTSRENATARIGLISEAKGVDYAFEAVGKVELMTQAVDVIRPGGTTVLLGSPPYGSTLCLDALSMIFGKAVFGSPTGLTIPHIDIPRFVDLYMMGRLPVDKLLTRTYGLDQINEALQALEKGEVMRSVITY